MAEAAAFVVHRNREDAKKAALQMEEGLRGAVIPGFPRRLVFQHGAHDLGDVLVGV